MIMFIIHLQCQPINARKLFPAVSSRLSSIMGRKGCVRCELFLRTEEENNNNEGTDTVIYKSKRQHSKPKGGKTNFQVFNAKEFIAAISLHLPEKSFQLVRYYG